MTGPEPDKNVLVSPLHSVVAATIVVEVGTIAVGLVDVHTASCV